MNFSILGPIEVHSDVDSGIAVTAPRVVTLLALLLIRRGEVVPAEEIGDVLWPDKTVAEQSTALRFHIWKLRSTLEPDRRARSSSLLRTTGPGYVLDLTGHHLDADEFDRRIATARTMATERPRDAVLALDGALTMWRGDPLADVRYEDFAQGTIRRLTALKRDAEMMRVDALIVSGRHREAIVDVEPLIAANPFVERLWIQLIGALCLDGRRGDAIGAYRRALASLTDELGIDPSPAFRRIGASLGTTRRAPVAT